MSSEPCQVSDAVKERISAWTKAKTEWRGKQRREADLVKTKSATLTLPAKKDDWWVRESTRLAGVLVALLICQISQPSAANHQ